MRSLFFIATLCLAYATANTIVAPSKTVFDSINNFSANFFKALIKKYDKNIFVSPLNAYVPLAMLSYGASGETKVQMQKSLDLFGQGDLVKIQFQELFDSIENVNNVTVHTHNYLFGTKNDTIKVEFKNLISGLIFSPTSKDTESADLDLLNVMYLNGNFSHRFEKEKTMNKTFHLDEENEIEVQMMHTRGSFEYGELHDDDAKFIELPYENKNLKMIIVLPNKIEGLGEIEKNVESVHHYLLTNSKDKKNVDLYLPKFIVENVIDIANIVSELGMPKIITDESDFSGIVANEPLKVKEIKQIAFLRVDEGNINNSTSPDISTQDDFSQKDHVKFVVDRPFYFIIKSPEVILFQSRIIEPLFN